MKKTIVTCCSVLLAAGLFAGTKTGDGYNFYFQGDFTAVQTVAPTGTECRVVLDGARFTQGFTLPAGKDVRFAPTNDTVSTFSTITGPKATMRVNGAGTVSLTGANTLVSVSNLVVKAGTLKLKSTGVSVAKTPVVDIQGYLKQSGGTIDLDMGVTTDLQIYGLYVANKDLKDAADKNMGVVYAEFSGGTLNARVGGTKSSAVYINKGSVDVTFKDADTVVTAELVGPEPRVLSAAGDVFFKNGSYQVRMPASYDSIYGARVFKSDKKISIAGGHFDVNVPGPDAEIFSAAQEKITIDGGIFELVASDDCFSAHSRITVNGGLIYAVSLEDDVFDSNGDMLIKGGTILAYTTAEGHEAFDVDPEETLSGADVHQLVVTGGTIFATGGPNSAWPEIGAGTTANIHKAVGRSSANYSNRYLVMLSENGEVKYAAKLPTMSGSTCSIFATCPSRTGDITTSVVTPTAGDQHFHDTYIWHVSDYNQKSLRILEMFGSTDQGTVDVDFGDVGEYVVVTNISAHTVTNKGFNLKIANAKSPTIYTVDITRQGGTIPPYGSLKLTQSGYAELGWSKITNGDIVFTLTDLDGAVVQSGAASFNLYAECDGEGASLVARTFGTTMTATKTDWTTSVGPFTDGRVVKAGSEYYFKGTYAGLQTVLPSGSSCRIILDGATFSKGFLLPDDVVTEFVVTNATQNTFAKIAGETATLQIGGAGTVGLSGQDTLVTVSNLVVNSGTFKVQTVAPVLPKTKVVQVLGYVKQTGGEINLDLNVATTNQIYGLFLANKSPAAYGEFSGGTLNATIGGRTASGIYGQMGSADVTFKGTFAANATLRGQASRFVNLEGNLFVQGGTYTANTADVANWCATARVFRCSKDISVSGGKFTVVATSPGSEIFSSKRSVLISGGRLDFTADDDCISAETNITVSAGTIYGESLNNNVFDSNGDISISGGSVLAYATAAGYTAFDVDPAGVGLVINGGTIFATGGAGSAWPTKVSCGGGVKVYKSNNVTAATVSGKFMALQNVSSKEHLAVVAKLPKFTSQQCAVFATCPNYTYGPTYASTAPTTGSQYFHNYYIVPVTDAPAPVVGSASSAVQPFVLTDTAAAITISNAAAWHRYGYKKAATLAALKTAPVVYSDLPAAADGALLVEVPRSTGETSCFYQVVAE